ncbi:MAG: type 4a pilus biogenesis protein PilO [Candidatus Omnitrophica bacterium]|nr:type 4a pilus biogenesis protein PilO [Candidatus Omnitrophota bacterium]
MNLIEKLKPYLDKIDNRNKTYILIGVLVSIVIFDFTLLLWPQISTLSKIGPEITKLETDLEQTRNDILRMNQYQKQVEEYREKLKIVEKKILSKEEIPIILEKISRLAIENGVVIEQIVPGTDSAELILESGGKNYFSLPIRIQADSGYHQFGRFLNQIEREEINMKVGDFTIASRMDMKEHAVEMVLIAVVFDEQ